MPKTQCQAHVMNQMGKEPAPLTAFKSGLASYLNYKASIKKATLVRFLVLMWPEFIALGKEN